MKIRIEKSYSSTQFNEYDVIIKRKKVAYYIEHFIHPIDNKVLDKPVYELYYDYNDEDEEFTSSLITEQYSDVVELIHLL